MPWSSTPPSFSSRSPRLLGIALPAPAWRMALRWPLVVAAALATVLVYVARQSGEVLKESLGDQLEGQQGR